MPVRVSAATHNKGNAVNIHITTNTLQLSGKNALISSQVNEDNSASFGNAGNTKIDAKQITLLNSAIISTTTFHGTGGKLTIDTEQLTLDDSHMFSATLSSGNSGGMQINANHITLDNNSIITTSNLPTSLPVSTGNVGLLEINTESLKMQNNSDIMTTTAGAGQGADLIINGQEHTLK
ncbi:MAG: hypothetical protein V3U87_06015 [Methylococcaceae bacterium]